MVLSYYGIEETEDALAVLYKTNATLGTTIEAMAEIFGRYGFGTKIHKKADFSLISSYITNDIPVIVDWFSGGRRDYPDNVLADGNYSIVVDIDGVHITLQDSEIGKERKLLLDDFMKVWFDFKGEYVTSWEDLLIRECLAIIPPRLKIL